MCVCVCVCVCVSVCVCVCVCVCVWSQRMNTNIFKKNLVTTLLVTLCSCYHFHSLLSPWMLWGRESTAWGEGRVLIVIRFESHA